MFVSTCIFNYLFKHKTQVNGLRRRSSGQRDCLSPTIRVRNPLKPNVFSTKIAFEKYINKQNTI